MKTAGILFGNYLRWADYPFSKKRTNEAYELFTEIGKQNEVRFLISTFGNLEEDILKKAWVFENKWKIAENEKIDLIFDRDKTTAENIESKKEISKKIKIVNAPEFNLLCWDKFESYKKFPNLMPKTFLVKDIDELKQVLSQIKTEKIVLKPRYGIMGKDIEFLNKDQIKEVKENIIVQEFIDSSGGIEELGMEGVHDLRVVIINGEINHSYIRVAKEGSLFANCARGGKKMFIDKIPSRVIELVKEIDSRLEKYYPRVYSIDFVYGKNGKIRVAELESIPGFAYYDEAEEIRQKFIEKMIDVLK